MDNSYSIIPLSILILFLYFLSWWFTYEKIIPVRNHRMIWNTLLLLTFVIAAFLGLLLVINIRYKLEIPWIKKAMLWHVEFGIGMTFSGMFHLIWHWNYFPKILRTGGIKDPLPDKSFFLKSSIYNPGAAAFVLGFGALLTQLLFLRQFLDFFNSQELIIGLVLAAWMIYTGLGAWVGSLSSRTGISVSRLFYWLGAMPVILLLLSWVFRVWAFDPGETTGPLKIALFTLLFAPYGLLSGYSFSSLTRLNSTGKFRNPAFLYYHETLGAALSGLLYTLLSHFYGITLILAVFPLLASFILIVLQWKATEGITGKLSIHLAVFILVVALILVFRPDNAMLKILLQGQKILVTKETPLGRMTLTSRDGQLTYYNGGTPIWSSGDAINREESVHYAMLQSPSARNVLVFSGDLREFAEEIHKYKLGHVVFFPLNPWYSQFLPDSLKGNMSERVVTPSNDIIDFLVKDNSSFDVVIINISNPSNAFLNKFYTDDFIRLVKSRMNPSGILSYSLPTAMNYQGRMIQEQNASLFFGLQSQFHHTLIIPGDRLYFLASDDTLRDDISHAVEMAGIQNEYVNAYYIDDELTHQRSKEIMASLDSLAPVNTIWKPLGYLMSARIYLDQFKTNPWWILAVILLLIAPVVIVRSSGTGKMFIIGFGSAGLEYLILVGYQAAYGNFAHESGFLLAVFMMGSSLGAFLTEKYRWIHNHSTILLITNFLIVVFFSLGLISINLFSIHRVALFFIYPVMLFLAALIPGLIYGQSTGVKNRTEEFRPGGIYGSDLAGSALGMISVSLFLLPLWGMTGAIFLLGFASVVLLVMKIFNTNRGNLPGI